MNLSKYSFLSAVAGACFAALASTAHVALAQQPQQVAAQAQQHPLQPALELAYRAKANIEQNIQDYSCTLVKRERIGNTLGEREFIFTKVRHEPFSVYMHFLAPASAKGREVVYYPTKNDGNLIAREGSGLKARFGAVSLKPDSMLAMQGNRNSIKDVGISRLVQRLIDVAEHDMQYGECDVKFFEGGKVGDRPITCIQVTHPVPRKEFLFHVARIFIDNELQIPIRYEAYDWPSQPNGEPQLLEEYTYMNLKLNNGFSEGDFDTKNPEYGFER